MKRTLALISCVLTLAFVGGTTLISAENGQKVGKATVRAVHGDVKYSVKGGPLAKLRVNMTLSEGATIVTGADSTADLSVNGVSSVVRINSDSKIALSEMTYMGSMQAGDHNTTLDLGSGQILGNVKKVSANSSYHIKTPNGVAGIRGTDFQITISMGPNGQFSVTFSSVQGVVIVAAVVDGATITKTLNTGQSWTPGKGDVVATEVVTQDEALRIVTVLNAELPVPIILPPVGPVDKYPTGTPPSSPTL